MRYCTPGPKSDCFNYILHSHAFPLSLSLFLSLPLSLSPSQYVCGSRALKFGRRFGQGQHVQEQGPRSRNKSWGRWWESSLGGNIRHKGRVYSSATIFWQAFFLTSFNHLNRQINSDERPLLMSSTDLSLYSLPHQVVLRFTKSSDMFVRVLEVAVSGLPYS